MRVLSKLLIPAILIFVFPVFFCAAQAPLNKTARVTEINIDAAKPAAYTVPRTIFGSFLEPIENSTYGGLVAELLENPSFEEGYGTRGHQKKILTR